MRSSIAYKNRWRYRASAQRITVMSFSEGDRMVDGVVVPGLRVEVYVVRHRRSRR